PARLRPARAPCPCRPAPGVPCPDQAPSAVDHRLSTTRYRLLLLSPSYTDRRPVRLYPLISPNETPHPPIEPTSECENSGSHADRSPRPAGTCPYSTLTAPAALRRRPGMRTERRNRP